MISQGGSGPQASTVLYTIPQVPAGPAQLSVKGSCNHGNVHVFVPGVGGFIDLTGGATQEVTASFLAEPGEQITYTVSQDVGQTVVWSFDFYLGLPTDIAF